MSDTLRRAVEDASCIIVRQEDQIQRALQVLQKAQRYDPEAYSRMERRELGGWVDADDVDRAIQILQEGQQ
jgi:hypothetical protein